MKFKHLLLILSLFFTIYGCYKYPKIDYNYQQYNRLVGPDGGKIVFYLNYANDSSLSNGDTLNNRLLEMTFPEGALDTEIVMNFYQFQDYQTAEELSKGLSLVGTKFIYFVPVYASDGYHEHDNADLSYHLSLQFNKPVTITYFFDTQQKPKDINEKKLQFEFYDLLNQNYRLYKIKIPGIDEWGYRNIFVQWNQQGYPVGYNASDLTDIILGLWFNGSDQGDNNSNLINWQQVDDVSFDEKNNSISFKITNTDYLYVLAKIILIPESKLPFKIKNFTSSHFTSPIKRASFVDNTYKIVLDNGYIIYFSRNGDFMYTEKYNINYSQLPDTIKNYVAVEYPQQSIKSNFARFYIANNFYYITLSNDVTLEFSGTLLNLGYSGILIYDFGSENLQQNILTFINANYPNSKIQNVTLQDFSDAHQYIVYLNYDSKNIKLYFDLNGQNTATVYFGLKKDEISSPVSNYVDSLFPGVDMVSVSKIIKNDSIYYDIDMLNNAFIEINQTGKLYYADYYVKENNIPKIVDDSVHSRFKSNQFLESYYTFDNGFDYYYINYAEGLNVYCNSKGEVLYALGNNFNDLFQNTQQYIQSNYTDMFSDFVYMTDSTNKYIYSVVLTDGTNLIFDKSGNFIKIAKHTTNTKYFKKEKPIRL